MIQYGMNIVFHYMDISQFIRFSVDEHSGWFHFGAVTNVLLLTF